MNEDASDYDSSESLTEEEAWALLQAQEEAMQEEPQVIPVQLVRKEALFTTVTVDLLNGTVVEGEAVVDTGSVVTLLNLGIVTKYAPQLLQQVDKDVIALSSISGETLQVAGSIELPCRVAGRSQVHRFVIANVVEPFLIGMDFMKAHQATWDWTIGDLVFPDPGDELAENACRLVAAEEVPPGTAACLRVQLHNSPDVQTLIHFQARELGLPGMVVADALEHPREDYAEILVENRSEQAQTLPAGLLMGQWEEIACPEAIQTPASPSEEEPKRVNLIQPASEERQQRLLEELKSHLDLLEPQLNDAERTAMQDLFIRYQDVFALDSSELGVTDLIEHEIDVGDSRPIKIPPRRIPMHKVDVVEKTLQEMEDKGIIRPSMSPWSAPVVIVQKKDGTLRFCVDYRGLNAKTIKDAYPLPRIEDNLDSLRGAHWFTTLDLASGYWQVAVAEKDKPKTAFTTRFGLYEFNVLPFGLTNGPATFQRLMERVLRGLQWKILVLYLDDIIVFADTFLEHMLRLEKVLQRLREANLRLKLKKCQFFKNQVNFLGHVIDCKGIHMDPEKVRTINDWLTPVDLHDLRSFLGLAAYYRRFVKGYAAIASPLYDLTRKNVDFQWGEAQQEAFEQIKSDLTNMVTLSYPVSGTEFLLDTDASASAIGAVLSQVQDGVEKVISFGSRCLSTSERNYCVTRKEMLAVVYFMCHYKHYLIGAHVTVRSDHGSLRWLKNMKQPTGQVARWMERLAPFDWVIQHRPGRHHQNADALSRARCPGDCVQCSKIRATVDPKFLNDLKLLESLQEEVLTIGLCQRAEAQKNALPVRKANAAPGKPSRRRKTRRMASDQVTVDEFKGIWDLESLQQATAADPVLKEILTWQTRPSWEEVATKSLELKFYWQSWPNGRVTVRNDLVWYQWSNTHNSFTWKLVVPNTLQIRVLELFAQSTFFWSLRCQ